MIKKLEKLAGGRYYLIGVLAAVCAGIFLRFYRLYDFVTFLGDQGRDAIILKRLITFEHFPAIGAPTSVGAIFLGPFYYYFIAPWIALFGFDPSGPAFGVAFFSSLLLIVQYLAVKDILDKKTALISTALTAISWSVIEPSRFSWNPNLLPQFTFLSVYSLVKCVRTSALKWFALFGLFAAIIVQLHYLSLVALPIFIVILVSYLWKSEHKKAAVKNIGIAGAVFFILSIPLIIFDFRHEFLNSRNFIRLFTNDGGVGGGGSLNELFHSLTLFNTYFFQFTFSQPVNIVILISLLIAAFFAYRAKNAAYFFILTFVVLLAGTSLYQGTRHPHYFNTMYVIYSVILGYFLSHLTFRKAGWLAVIIFIASYGLLNYRHYAFFHNTSSFQIARARKIARAIYSNVTSDKYTVTALPNQYADSTYRYFLEIWDKRPIEKDSLDPAGELFVVCEEECKPIGNAQWDIAYFAPTKTLNTIPVDTVTIHKLGK